MRRLALASLILFTLGGQALAQDADAAAAAAPEPEPSPAEAEAMQRFGDAQALFERGDRQGALTEMLRIYELLEGSPTQYVVLYNLGRVYEELFQYDRAIELYERYVRDAPEDAEDRADAQASLRALERLLGTIAITTNAPNATVWIGEAEVGHAPGEIRIAAGHHVLELRAAGYESVRREIDVASRTRLELDLPLAQLSDFRGVTPIAFVSTTVGAVVSLGIAIGLGVNASALHDSAASCGNTMGCMLDVPGRMQTIRDFALAADVMYGVAGLFGIASVVLAFITDWGGSSDAAPTAPTVRLSPTLGGGVLDVTF